MLLKDIAVIVGMPRAGTTWLYENLKNHPDICVSDYKEINRYLLGLDDRQYLDFFCDCSKKIKLDISPLYYFDKKSLAGVASNHDKIILLIREPKEWIESLTNQIRKYDENADTMSKTKKYIFQVGGRRKIIFDYSTYRHDLYIDEIKNILGNKLLVLNFSLLQREPVLLLKMVENYLGISDYFTADNYYPDKINASGQPMSRLYAWLFRMNILYGIIPIALKLLPKGLVHRLRKRFVYGK